MFKDARRLDLTVVRVVRPHAKNSKRDPRTSWFVWIGDPQADIAQVAMGYALRFGQEHGYRFDTNPQSVIQLSKENHNQRRKLMSRVTKAAEHLSVEEVKSRMQSDPRPLYRQRWLIIYNALVDPRTAEEIARHCGVGKFTVQKLISRYNRFGISAVETKGKGGRKREYLTLEQERQFLEPFFLQAQAGTIATAAEIHHAFEERIGQKVDESMIYRLLQRHGWRKVVPRPRHPQAQEEIQEAFKKTFSQRFRQQLKQETQKISERS